jgi:hypothetical protein
MDEISLDHLNSKQQEQARAMIKDNIRAFARSHKDVGRVTELQAKVELKPDHKP